MKTTTDVNYRDISQATSNFVRGLSVQNVRKRFTLVKGGKYEMAKAQSLRTGCTVQHSGIYRVLHPQHTLPKEVTLIRNQSFPRCSKCNEPVGFELVRSAPEPPSVHHFQVALYELPEVTEVQELKEKPLAG